MSEVDPDLLNEPIVTGRGWGPAVVGARLADVSQALGEAEVEAFEDDGFYVAGWPHLGVRAYLDLEHEVTSIHFVYREIYEQGYGPCPAKTEHGLGFDSPERDVVAALGEPAERRGNLGDVLVYDGLMFCFDAGLLHEINIGPAAKPVQRPPLPQPPSRDTKAAHAVLGLVEELQHRVDALDDPEIRVVVTPTTEQVVERFESRRGRRLPASYRALVLAKGTLHVEVHGYKTMWMIPMSDLGGPEPTCWVDEGDPAVDHDVQIGIFFAYENDDSVENFHAFDPDTLDDEGEMCVGTYYHDARYEGGGVSFVEYLRGEIESLFERFIPAVLK